MIKDRLLLWPEFSYVGGAVARLPRWQKTPVEKTQLVFGIKAIADIDLQYLHWLFQAWR